MKLRIEGIMKFIKSLFLNACLEKVNLSTFLYCHSDGAVFKKQIVEFSGKIRQSVFRCAKFILDSC